MACVGSRRRVMYAMLTSAMCFRMDLNRAGYGSVSMPSRCGKLRVNLPKMDDFLRRGRRTTKGEFREPN